MILPYYQDDLITLYHGDCRKVLPEISDNINLLLTDPPFGKVADADWDRLSRSELSELLRDVLALVKPKLAKNAGLYVFAWPTFAAHLEMILAENYHVLTHIIWSKRSPNGRRNDFGVKASLETMRRNVTETERIIFAEMPGADGEFSRACNHAVQGARATVFAPLIAYFAAAKAASGLTGVEIQEKMFRLTGKRYVFDRHSFSASQWAMPTWEQYEAAATFLPLRRQYEELRRQYEELRRQYEELRRYHHPEKHNSTDLWQYEPVKPGNKIRRHICQKPLPLLRDMIKTSCQPGGVVLDCFAGSGATGVAAMQTGRQAILIEQDEKYCEIAANWISTEAQTLFDLGSMEDAK